MSEENNKIEEQELENPTSEKKEQVSESLKEKEEELLKILFQITIKTLKIKTGSKGK